MCLLNLPPLILLVIFIFFNDTATTEIYTLSLHDALPIYDAHDGPGKIPHEVEVMDPQLVEWCAGQPLGIAAPGVRFPIEGRRKSLHRDEVNPPTDFTRVNQPACHPRRAGAPA